MKLSLRWICDHIASVPYHSVSIDQLVTDFNAKVAEIEHVDHVSNVLVGSIAAGRVVACDSDSMTVDVPEWGEQLSLPVRTDIPDQLHPTAAFLVTKDSEWVLLNAFGLEKDGLFPALCISDEQLAGGWREQWEQDDHIIDVDNKSVTHRPDMWGHRGFAREIAALLGAQLGDQAPFLAHMKITQTDQNRSQGHECVLINDAPEQCSALAGIFLPAVAHVPCDVRTASRFVKVGYRPINGLVDATNYAMADWGQPMHAYDADKVSDHTLHARMAAPGEELELLDDSNLVLREQDVVVGDTQKVLGLAGIMGGKHDSIGMQTRNVLLESGCWHAASVRRTAAAFKLRTESSQRYEKTLDPAQTVFAIQRFLQLACDWKIIDAVPGEPIQVVGTLPQPQQVTLSAQYLYDRLGFELAAEKVVSLLEQLCFQVTVQDDQFIVTVPTYRASKDISGPHDLVEEVARQYGFENMQPVMPSLPAQATNIRPVLLKRQIMNYLAYGAGMREQRNYAFYDQQILDQLQWKVAPYLELKNPVSQQARILVQSLLPHLLHNVQQNIADHERYAFFEWGTVWGQTPESEQYQLAGVWYDKSGKLDFYDLKRHICKLCSIANVRLDWHAVTPETAQQWMHEYRSAQLRCGEQVIGYFGQVDPVMLQRIGALPGSSAYAFTLDASWLQSRALPQFNASAVRKHQHSEFDVSVLIPLDVTVKELERVIGEQSPLVVDVRLIDFFEKKEWTDQRSVALRVTLAHNERTVSREENDQVRQAVIQALEAQGGQLRT